MLKYQKYIDVDNTVLNMFSLVEKHYRDKVLRVFDTWNLQKIFNYISKEIPYVPDPARVPHLNNDAVELIKAPEMTMLNGGDCDDKSILAACIFERKNIPWRFVVVSTKPDQSLHHVYLEYLVRGKWYPFDATYPRNLLNAENRFTKKRIYSLIDGSMNVYDLTLNNLKALYSNLPQGSERYLMAGNSVGGLAGGVRLAILEGVNENKNLQLLGAAAMFAREYQKRFLLGFDPATIATVSTVAFNLFSNFFGPKRYQDAFNVWDAGARALPSMPEFPAPDMFATRALIAVLGVDYMNPPHGANVCTSSNRCGNRAEWAKIQPEVEQKAAKVAPFFYWLRSTEGPKQPAGYPTGWGMEAIYNAYKDFKTNGPLFQQYQAAVKKSPGSVRQAGAANVFITVAALAAAGLLLHKKGKL